VSDRALAVLLVAVPGVPLLAVLAARAADRRALAACLVPLSFPVGQLPVPGLPLHVVQLAALGTVAVVVLDRPARADGATGAPPVLLVAGFAVLGALLSTMDAVDPAAALRLDAGYLLGLGLAAAVAVACRDPSSARTVLTAACATGAAICAAAVASAPRPREHAGAGVVDNRATGLFGQP
jgi:hypothetical protein